MPTLEWIGKEKVINHHQEVPFRVLDRQYSFDENGQHAEEKVNCAEGAREAALGRVRQDLHFSLRKRARLRRVRCRGLQRSHSKKRPKGHFFEGVSLRTRGCSQYRSRGCSTSRR